jgi:CheY-like chemotaxis protein
MDSLDYVETDLPVDRIKLSTADEKAEAAPQQVVDGRSSQRILIVDDEASVADLIEAVLVSEGYTVAIARDGVQGILLARDWKPDLVLMDVMLPGVDGTTAIRRLKSDPETAELPIVAMSAGRTIRRQSNVRHRGAFGPD